MKRRKVVKWLEQTVDETLFFYAFPDEHWRRIRTNDPLELIMCEIRRPPRVDCSFPNGTLGRRLVAARLRRIAACLSSHNQSEVMIKGKGIVRIIRNSNKQGVIIPSAAGLL